MDHPTETFSTNQSNKYFSNYLWYYYRETLWFQIQGQMDSMRLPPVIRDWFRLNIHSISQANSI